VTRVGADVYDALMEVAEKAFPEEGCAFVIDNGVSLIVIPLENKSQTPKVSFCVDPAAYIKYHDSLVAVMHSHPGGGCLPSEEDREGCNSAGVPYLIVSTPSGEVYRLRPDGWSAPFEGNKYCYGLFDCFSLVQDYYRVVLGEVLECVRPSLDGWTSRGGWMVQNMYMGMGFKEIPQDAPLAHGDVLLLSGFGSRMHGHFGVLTDSLHVLHQEPCELSRMDSYTDVLKRMTKKVYRYEG